MRGKKTDNAAVIAGDNTEASDGERRLHEDLFADYDKEVRPLHDPTHAVEIDLELDLKHLKEIVRVVSCNTFEAKWKNVFTWKWKSWLTIQLLLCIVYFT